MGALEYEPAENLDNVHPLEIHLDCIADDVESILSEKESREVLDILQGLNGSSGGARPKVVCLISDDFKTLARGTDCTLVSARFVKPLDTEFLHSVCGKGNMIITLEENVVRGGFGESVLDELNRMGAECETVTLGFEDRFCDNRSATAAFDANGLTAARLNRIVSAFTRSRS